MIFVVIVFSPAMQQHQLSGACAIKWRSMCALEVKKFYHCATAIEACTTLKATGLLSCL